MLKKVKLLVPALLLSSVITGCTSLEQGSPETVEVQTVPAGADVYVNGDKVGQTPYQLSLGSRVTTRVRVEKDGYRSKTVMVSPKDNANSQDVVKFGPLYELGYYQDLTPNPIDVDLVPNEVPTSRSGDQYAEMARLITEIDQQRENGQISPAEHKYKMDRLLEYYTN
ncbi:PEGA domain-containing protein [Ruficoccus sp. ZRK36]|uniref:PEGA domain-containing protein n=1 Tax=Ruficoccus sp. ZRK36 TaxID=2866311 RepID=UPI001C737BCE|nr:PEGA domain-containing protein [Ruficoccus sp. ZRK36]QYY36504.1 PEGA domain-containing protein [Ruficoccus sp. ZRK36]